MTDHSTAAAATSLIEGRRGFPVGVIGAGRLGRALTAALVAAKYSVQIASRSEESARRVASETGAAIASILTLVASCRVVFLAVPDGALGSLAEALPWSATHGIVHCSGALGLDVLRAATAQGAAVGCLHPLQTFPAGGSAAEGAARFRGIVCGVEGGTPLDVLLPAIARDLGARRISLAGVDRAGYHAAAVLVSNNVVALMAAATRAWSQAGLATDEARGALAPLLLASAASAARLPAEEALTGPIARGDVATVERHLRALEADPGLLVVYRALASELLRLDLGHPNHVRAALLRVLGEA